MSIIKCPECGHQISDKAPTCPNCGVEIAGKIIRCRECGEVYLDDEDLCPHCHCPAPNQHTIIETRDINLYINSPGGDCYSGLQLVSVMDFIKSNVSTTVLGVAASMAAVIASNGEKGKRFALPYSRFMIHQPSSFNGYSRYTDSKIALQEMESVRNDLYEVLAKNSGKSIEETIQLCENGDKWMKAQQAIEMGYIDKIISKTK